MGDRVAVAATIIERLTIACGVDGGSVYRKQRDAPLLIVTSLHSDGDEVTSCVNESVFQEGEGGREG